MSFFNNIKTFIWSFIYLKQKEKSEIIENILVEQFKKKSCITIKFIQWFLPKIECFYNKDEYKEYVRFFKKLEDLYENCNFHDIEYTKSIYLEEFNNEFNDKYKIIEQIASGSLGQVYKAKNLKTDKLCAIKCLHPDVDKQIYSWEMCLKLLSKMPLISYLLRYYFPIDINTFIKDFKIQSDLRNEANHLISFYNNYYGNDLIVIPKVYKFSKNILVMSYEEGIIFDDENISDYLKHKVLILMRIFCKNNELINCYMHGDLHKGNWRIRVKDNDIQLVLYDFGFCWEIPKYMENSSKDIDEAFFQIAVNELNIDDFSKACWIFLKKIVPYENVRGEIINYKKTNGNIRDTDFLIQLGLSISRNNDIILDSIILQSIILYSQLIGNLQKYNLLEKITGNNKHLKQYYISNMYDTINFAETYNVFDEYRNYMLNQMKVNQEINSSIFNIIDTKFNVDNLEEIKKMAIQ